jgi:hypothetical protein
VFEVSGIGGSGNILYIILRAGAIQLNFYITLEEILF